MLLLLPLGLAVVVRGTRRFLNLGVFAVQPAEFARLALVVFLAAWSARIGEEWMRETWRSSGRARSPPSVWSAGLIVLQPNLSSAALLGMLGFTLLWLGGQPLKRLAARRSCRAWPWSR